MDEDFESWREYRKLILKSIEDLWTCQRETMERQQVNRIAIASLQVKCGVWGLLGGVLAACLTLLAAFLGAR